MSRAAILIAIAACKSTEQAPPADDPMVREAERLRHRPPEIVPTFAGSGELETAAVRAVYGRCAIHDDAWLAGTRFDATLVLRGGNVVERVNVMAALADPTKADGHVLAYMITFDERGQPALIRALKPIAAARCGMRSDGVDSKI